MGLLRPIYNHFLLKKGVPIFLHIFIFYHYPGSLLKRHFFCCLFSLLLTVVSSSIPSIFNDEVLTMGKVIEKKGVLKRYFDSPEPRKFQFIKESYMTIMGTLECKSPSSQPSHQPSQPDSDSWSFFYTFINLCRFSKERVNIL